MNIEILKESNEFLNLLCENISLAILLVDKDARIFAFNNAFKSLFNKEEEEILGEKCGKIIGCIFTIEEKIDCGETKNCASCPLRKAITLAICKKESTFKSLLVREFYIAEKRILKYFYFTTKPLCFKENDLVLITLEDITTLKETEILLTEQKKQLEEYNRQLNQLMAIVAHDLRNPLGAIKSFIELFLTSNNEFSEKEKKEIFQLIVKSINSCLSLLDDLLDFNRMEAGKIDFILNYCDYLQIVKRSVQLNSILAKNKNIRITTFFEENIPLLEIDERRIEQVLNNIISNAVKYSPFDSEIKVKVSLEGGFVKTEVIDEGRGLSEEEQKELFKPFSRINIKSTGGEKSTGLGLAIARKIIELHEGEIGVKSELQKGSNFYFYLPFLKYDKSNS